MAGLGWGDRRRSVAEPPGWPGLAIVGGGDGFRKVAGIAFDQGWIAHRRFVDDSDANNETVFDLDVNGHELLEDDAARGGRVGFNHGGSPCDDAGKRPQAAPPP